MIYLKEYNLIYIKSKKTASTLMEFLLWQLVSNDRNHKKTTLEIDGSIYASNDGMDEAKLRNLFVNDKKINWSHMRLHEVEKYFGKDDFEKAHKVSTIRNPYRQLVSLFNHNFKRKTTKSYTKKYR